MSDDAPPVSRTLTDSEERYVVETVRRYYGDNAIVRDWSFKPNRLLLHVETDLEVNLMRYECIGYLTCEIVRDEVAVTSQKRGQRIDGNTKVAYRRGVVLGETDAAPDPASPSWRLYASRYGR